MFDDGKANNKHFHDKSIFFCFNLKNEIGAVIPALYKIWTITNCHKIVNSLGTLFIFSFTINLTMQTKRGNINDEIKKPT